MLPRLSARFCTLRWEIGPYSPPQQHRPSRQSLVTASRFYDT